MKVKNFLSKTALISAGLVAGLLLGVKLDLYPKAQSQSVKEKSSIAEPLKMDDAVINVAKTAGKAVVSISSEFASKPWGQHRYFFDSPYGGGNKNEDSEFFRRFFEDFFGQMPDREYKQMGLGSGVIINSDGYILTNEHVVSGADKLTVTLSDGREFGGVIKGVDTRSDLAVIKINSSNLPVAALGNSDEIKIGQWVVAIGNPFGFAMQNPEPTVTVGVISALHRSLKGLMTRDKDYSDLIQTDAAINPGNSGGPLVNLNGEIIGVNVAIFSTSGGYQGLGFSIPINNAKRIISRLIEGKKIVYGWLGVNVQDLNDELAKYLGVPDKKGALVGKIMENSPAQKAGIKQMDVIRQLDGKIINNVRELLNFIGKVESGTKIKVDLIRDKNKASVDLIVGERPPEAPEEIVEPADKPSEKQEKWRGLIVTGITSKLASRFGIEDKQGVLVIEVEPNSPADNAGLVPGDVILEINKIEIKDVPGYLSVIKNVKGDCLIRGLRGYFLVKDSS